MRLLLALLLTACAFHPRQDLNTSDWASSQDNVFADTLTQHDRFKWDILYEAQRKICYTNLTLREALIRGDVPEAVREWDELGGGKRWPEQWSYMEYTFSGIRWFNKTHWPIFIPDIWMKAKEDSYSYLVAPDGDIPLPEVRAVLGLQYKGVNYQDSDYIVRVWKGYWILICLNPDPNPRFNLHHFPEAGLFALYRDGKPVVRIGPYTGFQNDTHNAGLDTMLPAGALRPDWRINPPKIDVGAYGDDVTFSWSYNGRKPALRWIHWDDSTVRVIDNGRVRRY